MRTNDVARRWLRRHRRAAGRLAVFAALTVGLVVLSYVGNQATMGPTGLAPISVGPLSIPFPGALDCARDPAIGEPPLLPPPGTNPDGRPNDYLHTCGRAILDSSGREVRITGVNWFGMETGTYAPDGLWTRNWQSMLDQIVALGFNAIRLPLSDEVFTPKAASPSINYVLNPDLEGLSGLSLMDKIVAGARKRGLRIVLDRHRPTIAGQSDLWYTDEVSEERWIENWVTLANRYAGDDTVIGVDLHNEPRNIATWGSNDPATDWRLAAERAGNNILNANPYLLVFVEGVSRYEDDYYWWGGQLRGVAQHPVRLNIPNRVVYSPHDYGPGVFEQGWFKDPSFPRNLPSVWDRHWGFIARENVAPVVVGEFGGRSVGNDPEGVWQRALLDYMHRHRIGFFNWSLNPNSGDTGGVLSDDWLNVMEDKQEAYRTYLAPPIGRVGHARVAATVGEVRVLYRSLAPDPSTANVSFSLQLVADGPQPLDLGSIELRYWLDAGRLRGRQQTAEIDYAAVGNDRVRAEVVAPKGEVGQSYVRLTFAPNTTVQPYQTSGEIMVRVHKSDWSPYLQGNAFSFSPETAWFEWERIGLYRNGRLVSGKDPAA